jgi:uncharacterized protein DUF397
MMWRKSSKSESANCVEVRRDLSAVRDSKDSNRSLETRGLPMMIRLVKEGRVG